MGPDPTGPPGWAMTTENPPKFSMKNPFSATHPRSSRARLRPRSLLLPAFARPKLSPLRALLGFLTLFTTPRSMSGSGPDRLLLLHLERLITSFAHCTTRTRSYHFTASSEFRQLTAVTSAARKVVTVTLMSPAIRPRVSGSNL